MKVLKALGVSLLIVSGSMMLVAMYLFFTFHYSGSSGKNETSIVHVIISGKDFYIPKGYIWAPVESKNGHAAGVNMEAVLPNFTPVVSEREEFKSIIGVNIHARNKNVGHKESFNILFTEIDKIIGERHGLKVASLKRVHSKKELLFKLVGEDIEYFAVCTVAGSSVNPMCNSTLWLNEFLYVSYYYSVDFMHQWKEVEIGIEKFVYNLMTKKNEG